MIQITGAGVVAGAAGTGAAGGSGDYPNTITIDGTVSRGKSTYEFSVSGGIDPDDGSATQEGKDVVDGNQVSGAVHRDTDVYHFSGNLTYLDVNGDAEVSLKYGDESDIEADRLEIVSGPDGTVDYTFTAADRIEPVTGDVENSAESYNDAVSENSDGTWTADGYTSKGYGDAYDFWGEPLHFEPVEGDYTLFRNGEEVTLTELTGQEPPEETHVLGIRSTADTPEMYYEFAVEGEITPDDSVEDHDDIYQDGDVYRVEGQVGPRGADAYEVPGKLLEWNAVDANGDYVSEDRFGLYWDDQEVALRDVLADGATNVVGIQSTDATPEMYYEFAVEGEITPDSSVEDHDDIYQDGDLHRVEGQVGPRGADAYEIPGKLVEWNAVDADGRYVPETDFGVTWNGADAGLEDVLQGEKPTRRLEVVSAENVEFDYTFTATDTIEKATDAGSNSAEDNDSVAENSDGTWTADGYTGNGYGDAYDFKGGAEDFQPRTGEFALYLDGQQVTPYELVGEEEPDDTGGSGTVDGGPVGGGGGYDRTVSRDAADYVVHSKSDLGSALSSAGSGDVVFVAGDAEIYVGSSSYTVPQGVTLASNRGVNDAPGGLLHTDAEHKMLTARKGARVTGLRVQGPFYEYFDPSYYATGTGIRVVESGVEVDNCEIWGFAYAGVQAGEKTHVHHNHIHHTPRDGLGYGVVTGGAHHLIEWNYFNYNRHAIASGGSGGYTVRYNRFGPDTIGHVIDMHKPGGQRLEIYNNTVEGVYAVNDGSQKPAVAIRGVPDDVATIYDNWFYNPDPPRSSPSGWTKECIIQVGVDSWQNVQWSNNHLGSSDPGDSSIGCPR